MPEDAPPVFARCEDAGVVGDLAARGLFARGGFLPDALVGVDVAVFVQEADAVEGVGGVVYDCDVGGALGGAEGEGEEDEEVEEGEEGFGGLHSWGDGEVAWFEGDLGVCNSLVLDEEPEVVQVREASRCL